VLLVAISSAGAVAAHAAPLDTRAVPQVQVPDVPVPRVSVPSAPVPSVPAPSVPAPSLPAPSAPSVPTLPHVSAPSIPAVPNVHTPAGGALSAGGALPGTGSGVRAVGPGGAVGSTAGAVGSTAGAVAGRLMAQPPSGAFARDPRTRRDQRTAIKRVRRKLRPVRDCLHLLPRRSRKALVLHLGLGDARPRSRRAVARRLGTSWRRVRRMERISIARLRRADRAGACDEGASPATILGVSAAGGDRAFALASFTEDSGGGAAAGTGDVRGERESNSAGGGSADDDGPDGARDRPIGLVDTAAEDLQSIALIMGGLLAAGVAVALLFGRLKRPDRSAK
jgi:hypothetical protein